MDDGALGKPYADGEVICRQGEPGDRMFVMQAGRAVVSFEANGHAVELGELAPGDIFGEMAIFERQPRSATVRAKGDARVLTLDKVGFLRRVHEDPSLAYRILQAMSHRLRGLAVDFSRARFALDGPPRHVLIVSADRPDLHARLTRDLADCPTVQVVLDRRAGERRQAGRSGHSANAERRRTERRRYGNVAAALREHDVVIVCAHADA